MNIMSYIEQVQTAPDATPADIKKVCEEAIRFHYYGICVNSIYVQYAKSLVAHAPVRVACTVGYPSGGACAISVKAEECAYAITHGADSVAMVLAVGRAKCGEWDYVTEDMRRVVKAADGHEVQVILEAGLLNDYEKARACHMAVLAGATSVRTVSGFFPYTTTVGDITLLRKSGDGKIAVSAGGITDYEEGKQVLAAGAANISTTCGEALVRAAVAEAETQGLYKDWDETNPFEQMTPEELFRYLQEKQQRE